MDIRPVSGSGTPPHLVDGLNYTCKEINFERVEILDSSCASPSVRGNSPWCLGMLSWPVACSFLFKE